MVNNILNKLTTLTLFTALAGCGSDFQMASADGKILCECVKEDAPVVVTQPPDESSSPTFAIGDLKVSQEICTSPCSVMFSVEGVTDPSSEDPFSESGARWDYGDEKADTRDGKIKRGGSYFLAQQGTEGHELSKDGVSRDTDTDSLLGMHTYTCEDKECVYYPGVVVMNKAGEWATKWTKIVVHGQDSTFPGEQTVCISSAGAWQGCPEGARKVSQLPTLGAWKSDTRYLLHRGESFSADCMQYDLKNITLSSYGDDKEPKPELTGILEIGRDRACNDPLPPTTDFDNEYWLSDITVEGLRLDGVDLGITYRNMTFHDLDMDFEDAALGGFIRASSADACTKRSEYDCSDIPTPYGVYISDSKLIGSRQRAPGLNVEFLASSCVSFFGVMSSEFQVAIEHNIRVECASRVLVQHNDVNGDHVAVSRGRKNAVTIRPEGTSSDDMLNQQKRSSIDRLSQYENKYVVVKDNYFGKDGIIDNNAARVSLKPSKRADVETTSFALVTQNVSDVPDNSIPSNDVQLAGRKMVCRTDNVYQSRNKCVDDGRWAIPSDGYEPSTLAQEPPKTPKTPKEYKK